MSDARPLLDRLGERRIAWTIVVGLALVYLAGFAGFYPRVVTVIDEMSYVRQAQLIATGVDTETLIHPITGEAVEREIKTVYPLGTALTIAPFVALGGWPLAFLAPALCLALATILTARWIERAGHSPLAAAVLLGFPAALVMGRVCMSETPSLLWVSLGLLLFWRGLDSDRVRWWILAGAVAGSSLMFRESNVLLFAPLFVGAILRRDTGSWALVVGGIAGIGMRLLSSALFWGDPFFYKSPGYGFSLEAALANLPLYAVALLVFVPGGLLAAFAYRGPRRAEITTTIVGFAAFYLLYEYSGGSSGLARRLVLGPRFFVPLLPLLAFALAEVVPRAFTSLAARWPERAAAAAGAAVVVWLAGLAIAAVGVHGVHARWSAGQAALREAIYENTADGSIIVSNARATSKFINAVYGRRLHLDRDRIDAAHAAALLAHNERFHLVLLDRTDSDHWRRDARKNAFYLKTFYPKPKLTLDLEISPTEHLRIYQVSEVRGGL